MLKDVTLGQYFPGDSVFHKMDPRTKLILVLLYIVAVFQATGPISYGVIILITLAVIRVSKVPFKALYKGLKPIFIIIVLTAILNLFYTDGTTLVSFWKLRITYEGLARAIFMIFRIVLLISGTFLLTYTTPPVALTDGLEILFNPLKKVKVPVHEVAMMMSMALRFIPTLIEETDKIISAQKARGADFESGNLIQRAKALLEAKAAAAEDKTEIYNEDNSYRNELVDQALNDAVTQALSEDAQTVTRDVTLGLIYQDGAWWVVPDQALLQIISGVA